MKLLEVIKYQSKLLFNNRISLFATIALPIVLTFLFSSAGSSGGEKKLYVCDLDKSQISQQLEKNITESGNIKIIYSSEDNIKKALEDQKIGVGVVIENKYSDNLDNIKFLQNYETEDNMVLTQLVEEKNSELKAIVNNSKYAAAKIDKGGTASGLSENLYNNIVSNQKTAVSLLINEKAYSSDGTKTIDNTSRALIGFLVLFLWFIVVQGSRTLIEEKENRTYNRILSTPVSYSTFLVCKCIAVFIYGAVHIIVILVAGKLLFNLSILDNVSTVSVILIIYLFALISLTMVIIPFMKTQQEFTTLTGIIILVTGMLGGTFFSLDVAPDFIKTLSQFTPQGWVMTGLTDSIANNSSISAEIMPIGILFSVGIIGLIITAMTMNILNRRIAR